MGDRTVLVTGAGGFIGSHLVELLLSQGAYVRALVRYTSRGEIGCLSLLPADAASQVEVVPGDIRDADAVRQAVSGCSVIYHLAALIGIPYSYAHPEEVIDTNVNGTANVLLAARATDRVERVVLVSTSEVYGTARYVPMDEEHPLQPQSPYAATKVAADALGLSFHRSFGMPVAVARLFNAFGPRQTARAVVPAIISQALTGDDVELGAVSPTRDFTFVEDTARGLLAVGERASALGQVIHIGSGREVSVGEIVRLVGGVLGRELHPKAAAARLRPDASEVSRLCADNRRARELLGWEPQVSLDEGLRRTIEWMDRHRELYRPEVYAV